MPVTPLDQKPSELTIEIGPAARGDERAPADAEHEQEFERRWAGLCAANPRLFNGPILAYNAFDASTSTVRAHTSDYKHLAVQRDFDSRLPGGTTILSVTGILTATAQGNTRCVCVAQRSHSTRVYGGLWELAPSGGIDVPGGIDSPGEIDTPRDSSLLAFDGELAATALKTELKEELGLEPYTCDWSAARILGLVLDERSGSLDIMFHVEHRPPRSAQPIPIGLWPASGGSSWEYEAVRWVPLIELADFVRTSPCIPPMVDVVESGLLDRL
ncbi:MAG: 8-oxo-dGTP pyrophosphatase MutT (NUDIX family) [Phycisphaerales bacterium]|jgi:8-oxo-dGTP pyrophosphatase MutT (NUDIX family)